MKLESAVGHLDTANVLSDILSKSLACDRVSIKLNCGNSLIVAQLVGGRLLEGSTTLPPGFTFKFVKVTLLSQ